MKLISMNRRKFLTAILFLAILVSGRALAQTSEISTEAQTQRSELENRIKEQNSELEKLNRQLEETQNKLNSTRSEKASLQSELNAIKNNINQLNLSLKADRLSVEKLGLEIDSLRFDIQDIDVNVEAKKISISDLLREMRRNDNTNLLTVILRGDTLADSVLEAQALVNTTEQLQFDLSYLEDLKSRKVKKVDEVNTKKNEITIRQKNLESKKQIIEDQESAKATLLANTKSKESVYQQELDELRKKQDEISDQISKFEEELRVKFDVGVLPTKRHGVLDWPVKLKADGGAGIITQHMGEVSKLYRGKPHNGLDIGAPIGTPVYAAEAGTVFAVDNNDKSSWQKYQYGKYVLIKHENGLATLYAHLSRQNVSKGQAVNRGDVIGYVGSTGYSTGPHLHFGVYWASSISMKSVPPALGLVPIGVVVNPEDYL